MNIHRKVLSLFTVIVSCVLMTGVAQAVSEETDNEGATDEGQYEYETTDVDAANRDYMRLYYIFGLGGAYWARKTGTGSDGMVGVYGGLEYRFSRLVSVSFDSAYGWLSGNGNQYASAFNPGVKIFPFMYKNPACEPFIFVGGKVFDAIIGATGYNKLAYGQGGFAGIGMRMPLGQGLMGLEFFARAEFIYTRRPQVVGGRGLTIPIYAMIGLDY